MVGGRETKFIEASAGKTADQSLKDYLPRAMLFFKLLCFKTILLEYCFLGASKQKLYLMTHPLAQHIQTYPLEMFDACAHLSLSVSHFHMKIIGDSFFK